MDIWLGGQGLHGLQESPPARRSSHDKFHVMRHLSDALDQVRRSEYKRVNDKERKFIKGQRYTLLSHQVNLDIEGRRALRALLKANKRLHKAYLLKESFGQLWDYKNPLWVRKFFESWKSQLRWQRLKPFEKFAAMIERHWDGIVSYCHPDHKVSLGFMEGVNKDPRHPAQSLRHQGSGVPDAQGHHLVYQRTKINLIYAQQTRKTQKN